MHSSGIVPVWGHPTVETCQAGQDLSLDSLGEHQWGHHSGTPCTLVPCSLVLKGTPLSTGRDTVGCSQPRQAFLMFSVKWCQLPSGVSLLTLAICSPFPAPQDFRNRADPCELWWLLCPGRRLGTSILCSIAFLVSLLPAHSPVKDGAS